MKPLRMILIAFGVLSLIGASLAQAQDDTMQPIIITDSEGDAVDCATQSPITAEAGTFPDITQVEMAQTDGAYQVAVHMSAWQPQEFDYGINQFGILVSYDGVNTTNYFIGTQNGNHVAGGQVGTGGQAIPGTEEMVALSADGLLFTLTLPDRPQQFAVVTGSVSKCDEVPNGFTLDDPSSYFVVPAAASAEETVAKGALVRFESFDDDFTFRLGGSYDLSETVELRLPGTYDPTIYQNVTDGEHTIEFISLGEGATAETLPAPETIDIQEGHIYTVVLTSLDQPPYIVDETEALASSDSTVRIINSDPLGGRLDYVFDPLEPSRAQSSELEEEYLFPFGNWGRTDLSGLDPQTHEAQYSFPLHIFPYTHVLLNGSDPSHINYSTPLSVTDWLAGVDQMENPPFMFNHFLQTATAGGFTETLNQCGGCTWNVFTDAAYEDLTPEQQAAIANDPATVINNTVIDEATTAPWLLSSLTTRGGIPIIFDNPFEPEADAAPAEGAVAGNVLLTVTTIGDDVPNVINIVDTVLVGDGVQNDFRSPREYRLNTRLRF